MSWTSTPPKYKIDLIRDAVAAGATLADACDRYDMPCSGEVATLVEKPARPTYRKRK